MARKNTAKSKTVAANETTMAHRLADLFDNSKATLAADMSKPIEKSRSKQVAVVGGLVGIGAALGVVLS